MRTILSIFALGTLVAATAVSAAPSSNIASYPLDTCIVSGEVLEEGAISKDYDGREVRFCCKKCVKTFEGDKAAHLKALDEAVIAAQLANYPVTTCVVSGEELGGEMGEPKDVLVGNRLVRLCCNMCKKDLAKDSSGFVAKLDAAVVAAQLDTYPATTCPISGEELGGMGDPYAYVYAGKLVRFCCAGCIESFDGDPSTAMAKIYHDASGDNGADHGDGHDHGAHGH